MIAYPLFKIRFLISTILILMLSSISVYYFMPLFAGETTIPGFGLDPYFCFFVIHTNSLNILQGNWTDLANLPLFYPKTNMLAFSDPLLFHSFLYTIINFFVRSKLEAIRYMFFMFFIFNWIGSAYFFYILKPKQNISIFVGWLFSFSLFFQVQSAHYQNLIVFPVFLCLIPLFHSNLSFVLRFLFPFFGAFLMLSSNLYFFIYALILFFSLFIFFFIYNGKTYLRRNLISIFSIFFALILAFPLIYLYTKIKYQYPEITGIRSFDEKISFSARPWDYFRVLYPPALYFDLKKYFVSFEFERSNFSGLVGMSIFSIMSLPYVNIMRLNRYNAQIMSIFIFLVGAFLVSGPLLFPWIYKVFMAVIPGLSEVRAVGRGGLLVNLAYAISIFVLLNKFPKKTNQDRTLFLFICLLLVSERYTLDFPTRVTHYQLPANIEANKLINDSLGFFIISAKPSVFVITETIEDFIRIPFYLSIETHLKSVNGYSGYNPKEWNHTAMLFKKGLNCSSVKTKNTYLFENANFILIEKISPFYMECGKGLLRNYQLVASSKNYSLFQGSILIK